MPLASRSPEEEKKSTVATSAKCRRLVAGSPVASGYCAQGRVQRGRRRAGGSEAVAPVDAGADGSDIASLLDRPVERLSQQHV
jgi:hypothetical protein